jgi:biopolymer transport protein ExbD
MMRFRKEEEDNFSFDMTPMIDVVFLLIIFFMVSTVFVDFSRKMDINLPTSKSSAIDESTKTLEVEMSKDKKIFLAGKPLTLLGLETTLAKMEFKDKKPSAIIRADKSLPYGDVIQVMGLLQKKGIPDISVAVK